MEEASEGPEIGLAGLRDGRGPRQFTPCPGLGRGLDQEWGGPVTVKWLFWPPGSIWLYPNHAQGFLLQLRNLRPGKVKWFSQGCTALVLP